VLLFRNLLWQEIMSKDTGVNPDKSQPTPSLEDAMHAAYKVQASQPTRRSLFSFSKPPAEPKSLDEALEASFLQKSQKPSDPHYRRRMLFLGAHLSLTGMFLNSVRPKNNAPEEDFEHRVSHYFADIKVSDYAKVTKENFPKIHAAQKKIENALLALIPDEDKPNLILPKLYVYRSSRPGLALGSLHSSEGSLITISTKDTSFGTHAGLEAAIAHEYGHWISKYEINIATKISGIDHPSLRPLIGELKRKIDAAYGNNTDAAKEAFKDNMQELVSDCIASRITCNSKALFDYLADRTNRGRKNTFDNIVDEVKFSDRDLGSIKEKFHAILKEIDQKGVRTHPDIEFRHRVMKTASAQTCRGN